MYTNAARYLLNDIDKKKKKKRYLRSIQIVDFKTKAKFLTEIEMIFIFSKADDHYCRWIKKYILKTEFEHRS